MLTRQLNINARKLLSFIIMLLAGAAVLSSSAHNVFAEKVEIHRGNGGRTRPNVFKSGGAHGEYYTGNTPIYCVQPRDAALRNGRYSRERRTHRNKLLIKVLYYGYGCPGWSEGKKAFGSHTGMHEAYEATHWMAAYAFYNGYPELKSQAHDKGADVLPSAVKPIYDKIQDMDMPDYSLEFSKTKVKAQKDLTSNQQKTPEISIDGKGDTSNFTLTSTSKVTIHVTKKNGSTKTASNGSSVSVGEGDSFYFTAPLDYSGKWSSGTLRSGTKTVLYVYNTDSPHQECANLEAKTVADKITAIFSPSYDAFAHIVKKDNEGNKVKGVKFKIHQIGESRDGDETRTTNANGEVQFDVDDDGDYRISEISAPFPYKVDSEDKTVSFSEDDLKKHVTKEATFTDTKVKGHINVHKTSTEGATTDDMTASFDVLFDGKVVASFTTDSAGNGGTDLELKNDPITYYTLKETKAPENYKAVQTEIPIQVTYDDSQDICYAYKPADFTGEDDGPDENYKVEIPNEPTTIDATIYKKGVAGEPIQGAVFGVYRSSDNALVKQVTTDANGYAKADKLKKDNYYIKEISVPANYVLTGYTVNVPSVSTTANFVDKKVYVNKVDTAGNAVSGAQMKILEGDTVKDSWTTDGKTHEAQNLVGGHTYTLREVKAPDGYVVMKDMPFTVTDDTTDQTVTAVDKRYYVRKQDVFGVNLDGAHLEVRDDSGNVVDRWITGPDTVITDKNSKYYYFHATSGLEEGKHYTLYETQAPTNYVRATPEGFTVTGADGNGIKYDEDRTMLDKQIHVSKQSLGGKEVEGAKMQIIDEDDNNKVVDTWTSEGKEHIAQNLAEGHHYILHEEASPDGYVVATDVEFYVNNNKINENYKMVDKRIRAIKTDVNRKNPIEGAKMSVIDKDSGKTVDTWTSGKKFHYINGLVEGKTYILREEKAPKGYVRANDVLFTVSRAKETQTVYMTDKRVLISKKGVKIDSEVQGAKMAIYESEDGKITNDVAVDTWTMLTDFQKDMNILLLS